MILPERHGDGHLKPFSLRLRYLAIIRAIATAVTRQRPSPSTRTLILSASQLGRRSTLWVSIPLHIFPQRRIFTAITDITTRARPSWTRLSMRQRQRVSLQRLRSNWDRQP